MPNVTRWRALPLLVLLPSFAAAQAPAVEESLSYELARTAAEAAEAEAERNGWAITVVIVDAEGIPLYLKRMTGASPRSYDFALGKARTSVLSGLSTLEYQQGITAGTVDPVPDAVAIEGGFPILIDGVLAGAIAASGVPPQQDAIVARAGLAALNRD